jgi:signal peptidase I
MGYGVISMVRGALAKKRNSDSGSDESDGHVPEADDDGILFPGFGASTAGDADMSYDNDPILTDCDGCDHPQDRIHAHGRHVNVRKHATV